MDSSKIRKYAKLMQELGLSGLEISENDTTIKLERDITVSGRPEGQEDAGAWTADTKPLAEGESAITSPMVGVFHDSPDGGGEPFVKEGETVRKGDTLCIIEAMKLMNEIAAEEDGTIVEICAKDGQMMDYGTELFRIKR
ncbi:MAG: acetyl-CoA carboxylase, biotin carboxyl carrier protein [Firmicutes bacterium]|nr:acetyl-CoA carboxylase, biotin carboxyl carrier protein [Bacillota bacterium]